jgi:hypothetical protein
MTSHKFTHIFLTLLALIVCATASIAAPVEPGVSSDQKQGSLLFYNTYTSSIGDASQNTRLNITNTNHTSSVNVHLFFVRSFDCSIADTYLCLTANQTFSFLASEYDPGETGFIFGVATDDNGSPINFNYLIGDLYVKSYFGTPNYFQANLGAEAFAAQNKWTGTKYDKWSEGEAAPLFGDNMLCAIAFGLYHDTSSAAAELTPHALYDRVAVTLAVDNIQSEADGNATLLILHSMQGRTDRAGVIGTIAGQVFDDVERGYSFQSSGLSCYSAKLINRASVRVPTGIDKVISKGRTGWMYFTATSSSPVPELGLLGSSIVSNSKNDAAAFNGGHNLHQIRVKDNRGFAIPVFPSGVACAPSMYRN